MVFNSLTFVVFFALVMFLHRLPLSWSAKKRNLLIASYLFYAAWNPPFVLLLWISTAVDWWAARQIDRQPTAIRKRRWLALSIAVNLGFLGFFKYGDFLMKNWQALAAWMGIEYHAPTWSIVLPVGISFYTFHSMSYVIDVYHGRIRPMAKISDFALFVTLFTQLVAGPILRAPILIPQLQTEHRATREQMLWGLALMTLGMFEKVVLADGALAPTADAVFGAGRPLGAVDSWLGAAAFSGQIFCDFAGYSTIAIGAALCLGLSIPDNFRFPYGAVGFVDFWHRWHISLSTWLRDYLYIPLGGNRRGDRRTVANLMITMLLGGLWHGASWTFVAWGALHGTYLAAERWLKRHPGRYFAATGVYAAVPLMLLTWLLVTVAWVLFRAKSFGAAGGLFASMIGHYKRAPSVLPTFYIVETVVVVAALLVTHWYMRDRRVEDVVARAPSWVVAGIWAGMLFAIIITQGSGDAFIYFQF